MRPGNRKLWSVVLGICILTAALLYSCGRSKPEAKEAEAPPTAEPTSVAAAPTSVPAATTAPTEPPPANTETEATETAGDTVTFRLPVKGDPEAPVTIIEFSDYL